MNSDQNYEKSLERGLRAVDQLSAVVSMIFLTLATSTIVAIIFNEASEFDALSGLHIWLNKTPHNIHVSRLKE